MLVGVGQAGAAALSPARGEVVGATVRARANDEHVVVER